MKDPQCSAVPAKTSGVCKAASPQNACAACASDEDCGEHTACWAVKDYACPKSDGLLLKLKQEIVV